MLVCLAPTTRNKNESYLSPLPFWSDHGRGQSKAAAACKAGIPLLVKQPKWVPQIRPGTGSCHDGWSSTFSRLDEPKQLPPLARRGSQSSLETELVAGNAQQQGTCTNRARFIIIYPIQNVLWTPLQLLQKKRKVPVGGPATATRHHTVRRGIVGR